MYKKYYRLFIRTFLIFVVPLIAVILSGHFWIKGTRYVSTENAYIKAHHLAVSSDIDGRTQSVFVRENDKVKKGDLLFQLDQEPHEIELARSDAELGNIKNQLKALRAEYQTVLAEWKDAQQETVYYRRVFRRQKKLMERGVSSRARYDEAERKLTHARQKTRTLNQRARQALARLGGDLNIRLEQHPLYLAGLARRQQAALNLRRTKVFAPADGLVGKVSLQVGEYVQRGKAILPIIQSAEYWIEANLKETQLTHVRPGQSAIVVIDAYPSQEWNAKVSSISPSTGAELSLLPPQNASGNWVKVVQRVPVRLKLDKISHQFSLRAGMTVTTSIDTGRERSLVQVISSVVTDITGE